MPAIWFLVGAFLGAFIGFFLMAVLSSGTDDRCALAGGCLQRR
jgi:hypothetical protein